MTGNARAKLLTGSVLKCDIRAFRLYVFVVNDIVAMAVPYFRSFQYNITLIEG